MKDYGVAFVTIAGYEALSTTFGRAPPWSATQCAIFFFIGIVIIFIAENEES